MSDHESSSGPIIAERLRFGAGFGAQDQDHVLAVMSALDRHLAHWARDQVELEIMIKDRGGPEQKVTLEAWLPGWPALVASASEPELDHALVTVRKDMIREIDDEKAKRNLPSSRVSKRKSA